MHESKMSSLHTHLLLLYARGWFRVKSHNSAFMFHKDVWIGLCSCIVKCNCMPCPYLFVNVRDLPLHNSKMVPTSAYANGPFVCDG